MTINNLAELKSEISATQIQLKNADTNLRNEKEYLSKKLKYLKRVLKDYTNQIWIC